jgi:hypothetical protein
MKKEKLIDTSGLEPATKKWVESVLRSWELEPHHKKLLLLAAQHFDRAQNARLVIQRDGAVYSDRFGCPKVRPEILIEKDSSICFARLLRELALDVELPEVSRPAGFIGKNKK